MSEGPLFILDTKNFFLVVLDVKILVKLGFFPNLLSLLSHTIHVLKSTFTTFDGIRWTNEACKPWFKTNYVKEISSLRSVKHVIFVEKDRNKNSWLLLAFQIFHLNLCSRGVRLKFNECSVFAAMTLISTHMVSTYSSYEYQESMQQEPSTKHNLL